MNLEVATQQIWDYHLMHQKPIASDIIWALGSHDLRVADRAAELWHQRLAPVIVMSGGLGNFTEGIFKKPEAVLFAERAVELGVPKTSIIIEDQSSNTGENVQFTRDLLGRRSISVRSAIAVQKPYMERRSYATIRAQWPELEVCVTSPQLNFHEYCNEGITSKEVTHIMVGDLQRILLYPEKGYMIPQDVPHDVLNAMQKLIDAGYDQHLLGDRSNKSSTRSQ